MTKLVTGKEWALAENERMGESANQRVGELVNGQDGTPPLPDGWVWTTIGEACEVILGQSPPSSTYNADGIGLPFYQGKAEFGDTYPTPVKWCSEPKKIAEAGDILISVRAPVGPTNLCREKSCIGRGLSAIRPKAGMPNLYFFCFLRGIEQDWQSKATGTTFSAISGKILREQQVPLAPLPEQRRIVAEIETGCWRRGAGAGAGQPAALQGIRPQGRLRGAARPHGGFPGPRRGPRLRARRPTPGPHPGRASRPVRGGASRQAVQETCSAGYGETGGVARWVGVDDNRRSLRGYPGTVPALQHV